MGDTVSGSGWWVAHALLGFFTVAAIVALWATHLVDPGFVQPADHPPVRIRTYRKDLINLKRPKIDAMLTTRLR